MERVFEVRPFCLFRHGSIPKLLGNSITVSLRKQFNSCERLDWTQIPYLVLISIDAGLLIDEKL